MAFERSAVGRTRRRPFRGLLGDVAGDQVAGERGFRDRRIEEHRVRGADLLCGPGDHLDRQRLGIARVAGQTAVVQRR